MGSIGNRPDLVGEGRIRDVQTDRSISRVPERAHERLAQMTSATCDQDSHAHPHSPLPPNDLALSGGPDAKLVRVVARRGREPVV